MARITYKTASALEFVSKLQSNSESSGKIRTPDFEIQLEVKMAAAITYPHITKPEGDSARVERLPRIRVAQIAMDSLFQGWSADEICNQYPHLTPVEVFSALTYYFDHQDEIEQEIKSESQAFEESQKNSPPSALRLRLRAQGLPAPGKS